MMQNFAKLDWLHCNRCCSKPTPQLNMLLVDCGHIFCEKCVKKIEMSGICSMCNKKAKLMPISIDMEKKVQDFFVPVEEFQKKLIEIQRFQATHRNLLFQSLQKKYSFAKSEFLKSNAACTKLSQENKMLCSLLRSCAPKPKAENACVPSGSSFKSFQQLHQSQAQPMNRNATYDSITTSTPMTKDFTFQDGSVLRPQMKTQYSHLAPGHPMRISNPPPLPRADPRQQRQKLEQVHGNRHFAMRNLQRCFLNTDDTNDTSIN